MSQVTTVLIGSTLKYDVTASGAYASSGFDIKITDLATSTVLLDRHFTATEWYALRDLVQGVYSSLANQI